MAVLTSTDKAHKVHEFIKRYRELMIGLDGYEWIDWEYFIENAVYILAFNNYVKIITRNGIVVEAEIPSRGIPQIKIDSLSDCYCGE